ncbi:MAG: RidA family protein [Lachnospiraceae bacterium]|nr:RidA family protein [Lachnospiraceae bacterium]
MKTIVSTPNAPAAIGPYSQATIIGGVVYTSGLLPLDPKTGALVEGGVESHAVQVLENMKALLEAAGSSMDQVAKTTVYITDMNDFGKVNQIYAKYFTEGNYPARACVEVTALAKGAMVEIEAIATVG